MLNEKKDMLTAQISIAQEKKVMQWILFSHQSINAKSLQKIESAFIKASPYQKEEKEKYIIHSKYLTIE